MTSRRRPSPVDVRAAGVLLPIASLPGGHGVGDVGATARRFASWAASAGFSVWQILPVHPTDEWGSPYSGTSAFAGSPLLVDLAGLVEDGLLERRDLRDAPAFPRGDVDYRLAAAFKAPLLLKAARALLDGRGGALGEGFDAFLRRSGPVWLDDAALHAALKEQRNGAPWPLWEAPLKRRRERALSAARHELSSGIARHAAVCFLFEAQWRRLLAHCRSLGVRLFGDVPLYVDAASVDVWARPELFALAGDLSPRRVGGVPPDFFSESGQKWGNPVFRWRAHCEERFRWWAARLAREAELADFVRLDHFRGLSACWEIPARAADARHGRWAPAPGRELLSAAVAGIGGAPFAAEDLGDIDDDVIALRDAFGLPGMSVLQFGFGGGPDSGHLPHNHVERQIAYTGTHDNDTLLGWWRSAGRAVRRHARRYTGARGGEASVCGRLIGACLASPARLAVVPVQDLLGLGSAARTNLPGSPPGSSWRWRLSGGELDARRAARWRRRLADAGRAQQ